MGRMHDVLHSFPTPPSTDLSNQPHHGCQAESIMSIGHLPILAKHSQLYENDFGLVLEDNKQTSSSPLHSAKTFEELKLDKQLLRGIYQMGFSRPSRIQERALPQLLAYPPRNMIAQAQNGTGKTVH
jgi:hypothetical protein